MDILLSILIVIAAILLTFLVLAQNPKGGGLNAGFSGANQIMGARRTTEFLEKATWSLTGFIVLCSIVAAGLLINGSQKNMEGRSEVSDEAKTRQQQAPASQTPVDAANPFAVE